MADTPDDSRPNLSALLQLYKEQCDHGRHIETQRQLVSALLLTASGGSLGYWFLNADHFRIWVLPSCAIILGLLGIAFNRAYVVKWDEAGVRREDYRKLIEAAGAIFRVERERKRARYSRLRTYWYLIFALVITAGIAAFFMSSTIATETHHYTNISFVSPKPPARE